MWCCDRSGVNFGPVMETREEKTKKTRKKRKKMKKEKKREKKEEKMKERPKKWERKGAHDVDIEGRLAGSR